MATTICLINQKGGCGKSSTCFHLAGALSAGGLSVLLVDMDPQGSLSQGFLGSQAVEQRPSHETVAVLFDETQFFNDRADLLQPTAVPGISICPANQTLAAFNTPNPESTGMLQNALREFLSEQSGFDIVLIDCPPNLYRCSWTAMIAADFVVIPVPPEDFGTQGLRAVHQGIENAAMMNPCLQGFAHLVTRSDRRLLVHRTYEQRLRELYGSAVLETVIPEASAFKVSLACRMPVEHHQPKSRAACLTRNLSREILERINLEERSQRVA